MKSRDIPGSNPTSFLINKGHINTKQYCITKFVFYILGVNVCTIKTGVNTVNLIRKFETELQFERWGNKVT